MDPKAAASEVVDRARDALVDLSRRIHGAPELAFEEERAAGWVAEMADAAGFRVTPRAGGIETAFVATAGSGPLHVAFLAEYDALPGMGHACGHNLIAAMSTGAALAAARVADDVGLTVSLVGTPAEERGGGKVRLLEAGVFAGVHAALMAHPAPIDAADPPFLAWSHFEVCFTGKAAHASAFPEQGVNAADALTVAQTAIGLLRQHLRSGDRVHGIVTHGGDAANVVPAATRAEYMVRADSLAALGEVRARVERCFEAGAIATGARLALHEVSPVYAEVRHDPALAALYRRNAETLGRTFPDVDTLLHRAAGSTDMGNVSQALPAIHPVIGIDSLPAVNHQPEFAAHCISAAAERALVDGARALAWTAIDAAADDAIAARLRAVPAGAA
jgi:amidohydrolase